MQLYIKAIVEISKTIGKVLCSIYTYRGSADTLAIHYLRQHILISVNVKLDSQKLNCPHMTGSCVLTPGVGFSDKIEHI